MSKASELRALIKRGGMTIAPGAYDCITATTIAQAGFECVYMTGAGTAAASGGAISWSAGAISVWVPRVNRRRRRCAILG